MRDHWPRQIADHAVIGHTFVEFLLERDGRWAAVVVYGISPNAQNWNKKDSEKPIDSAGLFHRILRPERSPP
jgi:hypothetical protein